MRVVNYNGKYLVSIGRLVYYGHIVKLVDILTEKPNALSGIIPIELIKNLLSTENRHGGEFLTHHSAYVRMLAVKAVCMNPKPYQLSIICTSTDPAIVDARNMYLSKIDSKSIAEMKRLYPKTRSFNIGQDT